MLATILFWPIQIYVENAYTFPIFAFWFRGVSHYKIGPNIGIQAVFSEVCKLMMQTYIIVPYV